MLYFILFIYSLRRCYDCAGILDSSVVRSHVWLWSGKVCVLLLSVVVWGFENACCVGRALGACCGQRARAPVAWPHNMYSREPMRAYMYYICMFSLFARVFVCFLWFQAWGTHANKPFVVYLWTAVLAEVDGRGFSRGCSFIRLLFLLIMRLNIFSKVLIIRF